jgi:signal transduction histidine kinase
MTAFLLAIAVIEIVGGDLKDPLGRLGFALLMIGGLMVRRARPAVSAGLAAAGMVLQSVLIESPDEIGVLLAVIIVAYSVVAHGSMREVTAGLFALVVGVTTAIATDPSDSVSNVIPTLLLFVMLPAGLGLVAARRNRDLARLQAEAQVLEERAESAVEAERRRIAHELHDVVSHAVTLIAVQAEAGSAVLDYDTESARRSLAAIGDASRDALDELRRLLDLLGERAAPETIETGLDQLPALIAGARAAGLDLTVEQDGEPAPLSSEIDHCAYRVVQESLTNALRHASGTSAQLCVQHGRGAITIRVHSTGQRHLSEYGGTGNGLRGLHERVAALGGTLEAATVPGGFRLVAMLPRELHA